jgi:hypothetical protein
VLTAERAALFDAMDAIIADSEQQQEAQRLLRSLAVWIIFAASVCAFRSSARSHPSR